MKFSSLSCKILHFPKTTEMFVFNLLTSFWTYCWEVGKYHLHRVLFTKKTLLGLETTERILLW